MRRREGFSLAELLVYIAVLSVFTTALYAVFILSARHFRLSEARSDSLHSSLQAVSYINRALAGGANTTLEVQSAPAAIKFLSAEPPGRTTFNVDASGNLLWQKWVCFYYSPGRTVEFKNPPGCFAASAEPPLLPGTMRLLVMQASI